MPNLRISTVYENLEASDIESVEFLRAMEQAFTSLDGQYSLIEDDRSKDGFVVFLSFDACSDDETAVSAVLNFHEAETDADYHLMSWLGHFTTSKYLLRADSLVMQIHEEVVRRMKQGWV
ncbi:MAG: hypothetical protein JWO13_2742 [Acidobacteriales bacterium]|nr:hypothetical protein [Terriglobales bacterium]